MDSIKIFTGALHQMWFNCCNILISWVFNSDNLIPLMKIVILVIEMHWVSFWQDRHLEIPCTI